MNIILSLITMVLVALGFQKNTPAAATQTVVVNSWVYPNSILVKDNIYQSSDDPATITNWYKNKINTSGMNVTSFVVTSTNNNVLNKLAGGSSTEKFSVEISKKQNDQKTTIRLS